jgi:para-nitrobenzyl esterase
MSFELGLRSSGTHTRALLGLLGITVVAACGSSSSGASTVDAAAVYPASDSNPMCQATITQGGLTGKLTGATCEYLGVPYGAAPTAQLRFMPPKPAPGWSAPRDATAFGPSCLQAGALLGLAATDVSEDCLSVNVFTPKVAPAQPLPVMVFIYGGAFNSGSSSTYDAQPMSEKGPVVVVTMNYRVGALGFLALPELDSLRTGNPSGSDGIRDQQLALKWVQDNIATFHGDKTNVTVFGESAGSASTCIHIVSPGSQGLANRYILESGSCVGKSTELSTQAESYQVGSEILASFCAGGGDGGAAEAGASDGGEEPAAFDASAASVLACLQSANATDLMGWLPPASAPKTGLGAILGNLLGPPFGPTIEGPGGVLPDLPANLIAAGNFNKDAAILAGTNENEFGLFVLLATNPALGGSTSSRLNITTQAQLNSGIESVFGATAAPQIETLYPSTDATAQQVFIQMVTDYAFRCPTRDLARQTMAQGTKTYYLYSYNIGKAWHSFELVPLFDVTEIEALGATNPSKGYIQEMLGYWTQFAATGNPNAPGDAGAPTWPAYSLTAEPYLQLEDPTPMASTDLATTQCQFWDTFDGTLMSFGM